MIFLHSEYSKIFNVEASSESRAQMEFSTVWEKLFWFMTHIRENILVSNFWGAKFILEMAFVVIFSYFVINFIWKYSFSNKEIPFKCNPNFLFTKGNLLDFVARNQRGGGGFTVIPISLGNGTD